MLKPSSMCFQARCLALWPIFPDGLTARGSIPPLCWRPFWSLGEDDVHRAPPGSPSPSLALTGTDLGQPVDAGTADPYDSLYLIKHRAAEYVMVHGVLLKPTEIPSSIPEQACHDTGCAHRGWQCLLLTPLPRQETLWCSHCQSPPWAAEPQSECTGQAATLEPVPVSKRGSRHGLSAAESRE